MSSSSPTPHTLLSFRFRCRFPIEITSKKTNFEKDELRIRRTSTKTNFEKDELRKRRTSKKTNFEKDELQKRRTSKKTNFEKDELRKRLFVVVLNEEEIDSFILLAFFDPR